MATTKKLRKPDARLADSAVAMCQKGNRIYPARLALTENAFEQIKQSGKIPTLPQGIPQAGDDYDLRRLREGFVYILAVNAEVAGLFQISATAAQGQAWYIYRYRSAEEVFSPDNEEYGLPNSFSFVAEYGADNAHKATLSKPYIELHDGIENAYFMFSDMALPLSLLRNIEADSTLKAHWMQKVNLKNLQGYTADISTLEQTVKDFSPETKMMSDKSLTENSYRFTPVGKLKEWESLANQLTHGKGVIVALQDPVGTARDLAGYHLYLTAQRESILAKYEYAISTARILDAYALQQYKQAVNAARERTPYNNLSRSRAGLPTVEPASITFSKCYQAVFAECLKPQHLTANGDADILNVLKAEMQLDEELPGVNAINKMAYLPTRFGKAFKHLVTVHCALLKTQSDKLRSLYNLYASNPQEYESANTWCCYLHGLLYGLDLSPYGRNALISALPIEDGSAYNPPPYAQQAPSAVEDLKTFLADFTKSLNALEKVAKVGALNLAAYDLVIELVIDKIYVRYANRQQKGVKDKPFKVPQIIQATYQVKLNTREVEQIVPTQRTQAALPKHIKALQAHIHSVKKDIVPKQYGLFQVTEGLAGLNKALGASVALGFFVPNNAETELGQLGNDPFLASLQVVAGMYAPQSGLERRTSQALSELKQLTTGKNLQQSQWINYFQHNGTGSTLTRLRNTIINANTALAGVGAMFEYFNWVEADYKSDEAGKTSALLSLSGGLALEGAIGALGFLSGSTLPAGVVSVLTGLSYATLGIAIVLITLAIIYSHFSPSEMELWAKNGFWGNSLNYWGEPNQKKAYEWIEQRSSDFKQDIFESSRFRYTKGKLQITNKVYYYQIEMQRYLKSVAEIILTLDPANPRKIWVHYPGIYTEQDAQEIQIEQLIGYAKNVKKIYPSYEDWRLNLEQNKLNIIKAFEQQGLASLTIQDERLPYMNFIAYLEEMDVGTIPYTDLLALSLQVSLPNYQGNQYRKKSQQTKLVLTHH